MEKTLVKALVELEIQVVLKVPVVVEGYEVLKQFPQPSDFYGTTPPSS